MKEPSPSAKPMRCAIYTRVSTDAGLEQDFNSLDAQREAAEAYIKSQSHEGWRLHPDHYDDGGFSGGSMERPALQKLLADIRSGRIDVVIVYKVDRLTRSLADFAKLVELFDAHKVSFVSVTQAFNTTSSMGRLTLNVLLSFAQFEREVTGERIRDKIAASKKKGIWVGGVVPTGYRVENRKLLVDEAEAAIVRMIFELYLALGSLPALQQELRAKCILTRERRLATGKIIGGISFSIGALAYLLRNRLFLGELNHKDKSYPGEHPAIIEKEIFDAVQAKLDENLQGRRQRRDPSHALLKGLLFDDRGNHMTPSYAIKKGVRYRYYISCVLAQGRKSEAGSIARVPAPEIEATLIEALRQDPRFAELNPDVPEQREELRAAIRSITIWKDEIVIVLSDRNLADESAAGEPGVTQTIRLPWTPPGRPRRDIILPHDPNASANGRPIRADTRNRLLKGIALGRRWLDEIVRGTCADTESLARREDKSERSVRMTLSLAFLSPEIVKAAIEGKLPRHIGLTELADAPLNWREQRRLI